MKSLPIFLITAEYKFGWYYSNLREYLSDIKKNVELEKNKRLKEYELEVRNFKNQDDEEERHMVEILYDDALWYEKNSQDLALKSTFVTAYSYFEHHLKIIKITLEEFLINKGEILKVKERLPYATKTKKAIHELTGVDFSSLDYLWTEIDSLREIRNIIVHNGAEIQEDDFKLIESFPEFEIDYQFKELCFKNFDDIFSIIDKFQKYIKGILKLLNEKLDKNNMT